MYLKRVKIFGFKSFADEVIFDFSKGITSIVGPNGCGKSNILDAFNWVLGEQSAVRLRGTQMQDMIFHGSRTRKPQGVATVELTLDNSKDLLPIEYNEVTVMRKIYRSGESEYYINKTPSRLKDVRELFLDTGIGRRAYSIMEQDNIKYILESSPQERRSIIEEAAGIRKYKEKKLETERRLERIKADLNEVKNIMGEVQKNIRRLRRQKRRAQIFSELKEQLKYLDISRLCQEYVSISEQLGGQLQETGGLQEEVTLLSSSKEKIGAEILKLDHARTGYDEQLLDINRNIYQCESKIEIVRERIENFDSQTHRLTDELKRHSENLEYYSQRSEQLQKEIVELQSKKQNDARMQDEHDQLEEEYLKTKKKHEGLSAEIEIIAAETEQHEKERIEIMQKEIHLKNQSEISAKNMSEMMARKLVLQNTLDELGSEIELKDVRMKENEQQLDMHTQKINEFRSSISTTSTMIEESESEREKLLAEYHATKSQFDAGKKYLPQLVSRDELLHNKISGIRGSVSVVMERELSEGGYEKISGILGEKLGWIIAQDRASAMEAIKFLKEKNLPPLTFVIQGILPDSEEKYRLPEQLSADLKKILKYLIKNLRINEDIIWQGDCVVTGGGQHPPRIQKLMGLESEIDEIELNLKKSQERSESLKKEFTRMQESLQETINTRNSLQNEFSKLKEQMGQLSGNLEYTENELSQLNHKLDNVVTHEDLHKQIEDISERSQKTNKELSRKKDLDRQKREECSSIAESMAAINARRMALNEVLCRDRENLQNAVVQKEQIGDDIKRTEELMTEIESSRQKMVDQNERDINDMANLNDEKKEKNRIMGELENSRGDIIRQLQLLKEQQRKVEIELETKKNTVGEQRQNEERLKEKINSINVRLKEDMEIKLEDALNDYRQEKVNEEEIAALKQKLERIGGVNLEAPEEYEREFERFEFIKKHVDDLEEADSDLRNIIRMINKQTKERFENTFNDINDNFKNIFRKLFEGGKAELLLTDPDNILESGIEIKAKPEGKNVSSIIQFSGGESALCAIALMFAIYEVKPTPFCILDEVDSPLDDSNLHRFLKMLRDYTHSTQFIIVTHNKQTMEMSDTFYGITMEEFGVSKTISVKLREAAKATA